MKVHRHAKTTPKARALIVQRGDVEGWSVAETAEAYGVSTPTVDKWRARFHVTGPAGLEEGSSVPHTIPHRTGAKREKWIRALRAQRLTGFAIAGRVRRDRHGLEPDRYGVDVHQRAGLNVEDPQTIVRRVDREQPATVGR